MKQIDDLNEKVHSLELSDRELSTNNCQLLGKLRKLQEESKEFKR